jgi:hypothetical protein
MNGGWMDGWNGEMDGSMDVLYCLLLQIQYEKVTSAKCGLMTKALRKYLNSLRETRFDGYLLGQCYLYHVTSP